jgi:hypothetical protein
LSCIAIWMFLAFFLSYILGHILGHISGKFRKHACWIPMVLCTIFNCSPENVYNLFLTSRGKNGKVRFHKHCSMLTLKKYFCFRLLIVASKIDQYQLNLWRICSKRCSRNTGVFFLCCLKPRESREKHRLLHPKTQKHGKVGGPFLYMWYVGNSHVQNVYRDWSYHLAKFNYLITV